MLFQDGFSGSNPPLKVIINPIPEWPTAAAVPHEVAWKKEKKKGCQGGKSTFLGPFAKRDNEVQNFPRRGNVHSSLKWELHAAPPCLHPPACPTLTRGPAAAPASVSAAELAYPFHASADTGTARALHHLGMGKA